MSVRAVLVESTTRAIINRGLKAGDAQILRPGTRLVTFTGMKLNKMGHLKTELSAMNLRYRKITTELFNHFLQAKRLQVCFEIHVGKRILGDGIV